MEDVCWTNVECKLKLFPTMHLAGNVLKREYEYEKMAPEIHSTII